MDLNSILHHIIPLKIHCENKILKWQDRLESKYRYRNAIIKIPIGQKNITRLHASTHQTSL
jgi:7-keto-8-aminopelargonate synthetase-like enzyme